MSIETNALKNEEDVNLQRQMAEALSACRHPNGKVDKKLHFGDA
jgi:hypothetical protein